MFPFEPNEYLDQYPHIFVQDFQNNYASSSSSSSPLSSSHGFFNSTEFHHLEMHHQPPPIQQEVINHVPDARSHDLEKRGDDDQGLKFTLWKNEDQSEIKWMSSKMRLMRKMKKSDNNGKEISTTTNSAKFEDHHNKQQLQASPSSDHFSLTNASSRYDNHHPPIRVCADCNTTKTPLWRSGPKGPKSLCNACGIRQRKARRAMAAAAAAAAAAENGKSAPPGTTTSLKIKVQNKEFKKRCKPTGVTAESSNDNAAQKKKNGLEEFLFNLSKSLAIHRVFPQEEKDAAILLMALSCNRVHG